MSAGNGEERELPFFAVAWDEEQKSVNLGFPHPEAFKDWDFVLMCLEGAKLKVMAKRQEAILQAMEQAQAERLQADIIRRNLRN